MELYLRNTAERGEGGRKKLVKGCTGNVEKKSRYAGNRGREIEKRERERRVHRTLGWRNRGINSK